jgi:transcriptional regulator with XRE-family HTH domain
MRYMPARSPDTAQWANGVLAEIGEELRRRRKELGISAATTAEAAGMSRVTLHRIESGSPSVTVGAYMNAAAALGLQLALRKPPRLDRQPLLDEPSGGLVRVGDYPQLQAIAWQLRADTQLRGIDALRMYERNWRHVDRDGMSDDERALIQRLADRYGGGVLLV